MESVRILYGFCWVLDLHILDGLWVKSGWDLGSDCTVLQCVSAGSRYAGWANSAND